MFQSNVCPCSLDQEETHTGDTNILIEKRISNSKILQSEGIFMDCAGGGCLVHYIHIDPVHWPGCVARAHSDGVLPRSLPTARHHFKKSNLIHGCKL